MPCLLCIFIHLQVCRHHHPEQDLPVLDGCDTFTTVQNTPFFGNPVSVMET
ncbi:hypothetical protein [Mitsuokella sp.]|uniref:hypothetical protein n=1 Tax=Mitsuokella sp. TaxID=2049034 RepID=UPI002A7EF9E2|nr:hypothetical protein [Mitsuokella sp.]MDY4473800.1 hypothetical protein [Mitsuokella sp.]